MMEKLKRSGLVIMYLKMTRKCFLTALLIFPQYLTSVQSSPLNGSQLNKLSNELIKSKIRQAAEHEDRAHHHDRRSRAALRARAGQVDDGGRGQGPEPRARAAQEGARGRDRDVQRARCARRRALQWPAA